MELSIVIPAYRSNEYLHRCLDSIRNSKKNRSIEKIVVVNSSPEPLPKDFVEKYQEVQFVQSPSRLYAGAARNLGAKDVSTEWLCFLDSDCLWAHNWYEIADSSIQQHPEAVAFVGQVRYERPASSIDFALHLMEFHEYTSSRESHPRFVCSGNLLIKTELYREIGGFREDIPMCTDFTFAATIDQRRFKTIYFIPELSITHLAHLTNKEEILKKVQTMGYWRGFVEKQIPENLRISNRWWFSVCHKFLGEVFWLAILARSIGVRSVYKTYYFTNARSIRALCRRWAAGFGQGLRLNSNSSGTL